MSQPLKNITFCLTGTLSRTRDEYIRIISENGGLVKSAITREVDYLVTGDKTGATKMNKARRFNIPCISENELVNMVNRVTPLGEPPKPREEREKEKGNRFSALEIL